MSCLKSQDYFLINLSRICYSCAAGDLLFASATVKSEPKSPRNQLDVIVAAGIILVGFTYRQAVAPRTWDLGSWDMIMSLLSSRKEGTCPALRTSPNFAFSHSLSFSLDFFHQPPSAIQVYLRLVSNTTGIVAMIITAAMRNHSTASVGCST